jgi:hypothetical protein
VLKSGTFAGMLAKVSVVAALCALWVCFVCAGASAKTFSGTLSAPSVSADGTTVTAQVSATASCDGVEYCGFFLEVTTVAANQPCANTITGSSWVGTVAYASYGQTQTTSPDTAATWREWPSLYSGGKTACLYASSSGAGTLIAQAAYQVPAPAPAYTPPAVYVPTTPTTPAAPTTANVTTTTPVATEYLGNLEAIDVTRRWMKRKYSQRWVRGNHRVVRCPTRASSAQVGCYAVWSYAGTVRSKSIVITETADGYTISSSFATAPTQPAPTPPAPTTPAPTTPTPAADFCATHTCIPNFQNGTGSIVQCADGSYSHSGGKQGACSWHGGVASVGVGSARSRALTRGRVLAAAAVRRSRRGAASCPGCRPRPSAPQALTS